MRDLVDRGRVMNDLFDAHPIGFNNDDIADAFKNAPTIDAVEVVRCWDCVHFNHAVIDDDPAEKFEVDVCLHKDLFPTRVTPDFYCAHGEKVDAEVQNEKV